MAEEPTPPPDPWGWWTRPDPDMAGLWAGLLGLGGSLAAMGAPRLATQPAPGWGAALNGYAVGWMQGQRAAQRGLLDEAFRPDPVQPAPGTVGPPAPLQRSPAAMLMRQRLGMAPWAGPWGTWPGAVAPTTAPSE
jgi:hypothetical protein